MYERARGTLIGKKACRREQLCNPFVYLLLSTLIRNGNQEIKNEIKQLRSEFSHEVENINEKINSLQLESDKLKSKVCNLEKKSKKYNLVVYGIKETEPNPIKQVLEIINNTIEVNCDIKDLRDTYRVGRLKEGSIRPIICEVVNYQLKQEILIQSKTHWSVLKQRQIYFSHDYPEDEYKKRKFMNERRKEALARNTPAFFRKNVLVINGKDYTYEDFKLNPQENLTEQGQNTGSITPGVTAAAENKFNFKRKQEEEARNEDLKILKKTTRSQKK
ncbi:unnamed protein product [Phaedon cochleariae]|uniref:Endonuclease-reverse transcriptase n=1 Tax=Phaedon cochleariae TaxID=80249 RepID=A0A9N9SEY2_PHACE|nr:unnamed protein product [Phaedon cochleariae]